MRVLRKQGVAFGTSHRPGESTGAPYLLLAPALLLVAIFAAYPLLRSVWFALNDVQPLTGRMSFAGLSNFAKALASPEFIPLVQRTGMWVFGIVAAQLVCGLLVALLLNTHFPLRGIYRGLVMIPWATPSVLVALMWKWILDPNYGVLNSALIKLGLIDKPIAFLADSQLALPTLMGIDVWQGIPLFAVMILAALQAVSSDLKEAATIDGCGKLRTFRYVVLPAIAPTILITTVLRLIWTANYVDLIYILTTGGPGTSSTTMALEAYLDAYKGSDFGGAAAYAVMQALVLAVFVILYLRLTRSEEKR